MLEKIAAFVRGRRGEKDISQSDLAGLAQVSLRSIVTIENATKVRSTTLEKVFKALGYVAKIDVVFEPINEGIHD